MRSMCILVASGVVGVVMAASDPAEAARRRDNVDNFCRAASDLCVFVCSSDFDCPSLSDGYICETRRGHLIVDEGGERSYYETTYSFCWHRTRSPDDPLPDPEEDHIPTWPGSEEDALCLGCRTKLNTCRAFVEAGEDTCISFHEARARRKCTVPWSEGKRPRDRFGRPFKPSDSYCANVLDMDDALNSEYEDWDTDPHTRKRLLQARKKCEAKLTEECVEHFRVSSGSETEGNSRGVEVKARDFFGASYDGNESVTWGGRKGFLEACANLADIAGNQCLTKLSECTRAASLDKPCPSRGRR